MMRLLAAPPQLDQLLPPQAGDGGVWGGHSREESAIESGKGAYGIMNELYIITPFMLKRSKFVRDKNNHGGLGVIFWGGSQSHWLQALSCGFILTSRSQYICNLFSLDVLKAVLALFSLPQS